MYSEELSHLLGADDALDPARVSGVGGLLGESLALQRLLEHITQVASTQASVLIIGEPGTGKELVARCIHDLSPRASHPFLFLNCAASTAEQLEAELFGRAAVHGDHWRADDGYIKRCGQGTLLLDELAEMPGETQVKLLQVLESGHMRPLGGCEDIPVNCRILASMQTHPQRAVAQGKLRADLLCRIGVFPLHVPPLRERDEDVELLADYFLAELNAQEGSDKRFSLDSRAALRRYNWPGNVRELRNAVHRAFILAQQELDLHDVLERSGMAAAVLTEPTVLRIPVGTNLADAERWMIMATLKKCGGNKTRAAALLGVSLKTLYNRLNAYRAEGRDISNSDTELMEVVE